MPFSDTIGTEWAWVIPALSASAFFLVVIFGRLFPDRGAFISIAAILLGFVLFWYVLRGLLDSGVLVFYVAATAGMLVLATRSLEARRWR